MKDLSDTKDTGGAVPLHPTAHGSASGHDAADALLRYWLGLCRGGALPRRDEIDPRAIGTLLPNTFLLERIAPGLARFRVAGTHLAELMGMDVRGMPASCLIAPAARDQFADALADLFDRPARLRLDLTAPGRPGHPALGGRMRLLPLRGPGGAVDRALGCLVTAGTPGKSPRRFAIAAHRAHPVAPAAPPAEAGPPRPAGRPHLRLVKSD
jgi:hypothetical protein